MNNQVHTQIVSFIWSIADDCLRDVYVRGKYRDVILPMTVIRRLDAMLEGTIENVRNTKKLLDEAKVDNQWPALCNAAGQPFCNASPFLLKDLTSRASKQKLKTDFETYLDGFSPNVQEILEKFKFRNQIATMVDADILGSVIEKFVSSDINLSPNPVYKDDEKTILKHPGLDNHGMGTIFEELIRKFNEENNEEAGEHWTPRDVVELMADLIFIPIADQIKDATYTCYDGACGTGGMLTVAQDRLQTLATRRGKNVSIHLFGQEVQPETYAICKADMLLKGDGEQVEHIVYGSTLSADGNATRQFDFMLANPPYGKSWKVDAEKMGGKKEILDTRFNTYLEDGTEMKMIPRTSDGQLLFLLNNVAKMKKDSPLGSRIAEVHNGSSIFTGDAGSGESNARRYMIENDLVEAIIALPENMFYKNINSNWLGTPPEHWKALKLRQILRPFSEKNHADLQLLSVVREKGVIVRDTENDDNHNYIPDDLSNYKMVKSGQFAMNKMKAWQGSYGVSKYTGIVSPAYFVFDFNYDMNPDYFHYAIRSRVYVRDHIVPLTTLEIVARHPIQEVRPDKIL